jgi:hypothetical protein
MLLIIHITIALSSLIATGLAFFVPTNGKLRASYSLVGLTVASGTVLIVARPTHLVQSCTTGLLYLGLVFTGIILARQKLVRG